MHTVYYGFLLIVFVAVCIHAWKRIERGIEIERSQDFIDANKSSTGVDSDS